MEFFDTLFNFFGVNRFFAWRRWCFCFLGWLFWCLLWCFFWSLLGRFLRSFFRGLLLGLLFGLFWSLGVAFRWFLLELAFSCQQVGLGTFGLVVDSAVLVRAEIAFPGFRRLLVACPGMVACLLPGGAIHALNFVYLALLVVMECASLTFFVDGADHAPFFVELGARMVRVLPDLVMIRQLRFLELLGRLVGSFVICLVASLSGWLVAAFITGGAFHAFG